LLTVEQISNHRKKIKAELSWLIPRKPTESKKM